MIALTTGPTKTSSGMFRSDHEGGKGFMVAKYFGCLLLVHHAWRGEETMPRPSTTRRSGSDGRGNGIKPSFKNGTGADGNRTHWEPCSDPPPVLKTGANTSCANTPKEIGIQETIIR